MEALKVEAYSGYKGEETPRAFTHEGIRREIKDVAARWCTEQHNYFRVRADDGRTYVLRYELEDMEWELVMEENAASDEL